MKLKTESHHGKNYLRVVTTTDGLEQLGIRLSKQQGDQLHGMGAQSEFALQGFREISTRELGVDKGDNFFATLYTELTNPHSSGSPSTTYSFAPSLFWRKAAGAASILAVRTPERTVVENNVADALIVRTDTNQLEFTLYSGESYNEAMDTFTGHIGRMMPPPKWTQEGAIIGIKRSFADMQRVFEKSKEGGLKVAAAWVENWCGDIYSMWWRVLRTWCLSPEDHQTWLSEVEQLSDASGIKGMLTYFSPTVSENTKIFNEARAQGYLVNNEQDSPYLITESQFRCGLLDLTREEVREWFVDEYLLPHFRKDENRRALSMGAMIDFSENYPKDAKPRASTGLSASQVHQLFPEFWAMTVNLLLAKLEQESPGSSEELLFFRRGFTVRPPAEGEASAVDPFQIWMGDQITSWGRHNGLASLLPYALSLGLTGKPYVHADIGLYTTLRANGLIGFLFRLAGAIEERNEELLIRSMEINAFMALMRSHEGMMQDLQYWDSPNMIEHFAKCQRLFDTLRPARERLSDEYQQTGAPIIRPMWWHSKIPEAAKLEDQAMYGPDIVFKPIVKPGVDRTPIFLPEGHWVNVFTGENFESSPDNRWIEVDAPLGQPALLARLATEAERELSTLQACEDS